MMIGTYGLEYYRPFREEEDLYIYCAVATHLDLVKPGPVMIAHINRVFEAWLWVLNKDEDTGFNSIWEIDPEIPKFEMDEFFNEDLRDAIESDEDINLKGLI